MSEVDWSQISGTDLVEEVNKRIASGDIDGDDLDIECDCPNHGGLFDDERGGGYRHVSCR